MKPVQIEILLGGNLPQRLNEAERNIERLRRGANRVTKEMSDTDRMAQKLNGTVTKLVSAFAVKQLVSAIAKTRGEFQQLEVAFTTMLGSAEKANARSCRSSQRLRQRHRSVSRRCQREPSSCSPMVLRQRRSMRPLSGWEI